MGHKSRKESCSLLSLFRHKNDCGEDSWHRTNLLIGLIALVLVYAFAFAVGSYVRSMYATNTGGYWGGAFVGFFLFIIVIALVSWVLFPRRDC
jgi:uncharacterized membrane protein YkvI